jgi:outer membrane protein OmpA-like peptidoglycan-associated protein
VLNGVRELGFGEFSNKSVKGKLDLDLSYTGTFEAGFKWRLGSITNLYTGLYVDYTFNDVVKSERNKRLVEYSSFTDNNFGKANSVLASQYAPINDLHVDALPGNPAKSMTSHVAPVAFGLKLRLGIGTCSKSKQAKKANNVQTPEQARRAKLRAMIENSKDDNDEVRNVGDEDLKEELRRASFEHGSSLLDVINIEFEGYELAQSMLSPVKERMLDDKIAQIRKRHGTDISIVCEGHTCDIGTDAYNMRLGKRRAEEVRKYLINKGFSPEKVTAISKGQYSPIVPNTSEANRKKNRRVVLIIKQ